MEVVLHPVRVAAAQDQEGRLAFVDEVLVAVLVQLTELHEDSAGFWFLEIGFGPLDGPRHPTFPDLEAAQAWIAVRLGQDGRTPVF